jgi:hypothetical protein
MHCSLLMDKSSISRRPFEEELCDNMVLMIHESSNKNFFAETNSHILCFIGQNTHEFDELSSVSDLGDAESTLDPSSSSPSWLYCVRFVIVVLK